MIRRHERGFHHHNTECMIQIAIIAIIAAIAIPALLQWKFGDERACLRQLVRLHASPTVDGKPATCPECEKPYRKKTQELKPAKAGAPPTVIVRWRCPDPDRHLQIDHVLWVRGDTAVPHAEYPVLEHDPSDPEVDEGSWSHHTELHVEPDALVVRQWAGGFGWFFAWAILIIGGVVTVTFGVFLIGRIAGAEWSDGEPPLGCQAIAAVLLLLGGHYGLGMTEVRFQTGAPVVTVQNQYWCFDGGITEIRSPEALWAPPGAVFAELLHTDAEGEPAQTQLFKMDPGTPALLGPLHTALFGEGTVRHPAPEDEK